MTRKPFPGERPPDWQAPDGAEAKKGLRWWQWLLIGFVGLAILGSLVPKNERASSPPADVPGESPAAAPEPLAVSAAELGRAFEANEVAAQQRYGGQALAVTGTIEAIDLDFMDEPVVRLATDKMFQSVNADFDDEDAAAIGALAKGQTVTVVCGKLSEVVGSPMLDDCRLGN